MRNPKKLMSFLLALSMVLSCVPMPAAAADGPCAHHLEHDAQCGYVAAVAGADCTHICGEGCPTKEVTLCVHDHTAEGCVYTAAVEGVACDHVHGESCGYVPAQEDVPCTCGAQPSHTPECASLVTEGAACDCAMPTIHAEGCAPRAAVAEQCGHLHGECAYREAAPESWSCAHVCTQESGCITTVCAHVHDDACGYIAAVEGKDCGFVCEACQAEDEAVAAVKARIEALPTVEEVSAMPQEEKTALYNDTFLSLSDAYNALREEQKEQLDAQKLMALGAYFADPGNLQTIPENVTSGTCGDNVTWKLENGTLTISGSGPMKDYDLPINNPNGEKSPWYDSKDSIQSIVIEPGVTAIGWYAFYQHTKVSSVSIPNTVASIGGHAFHQCINLTSVNIPSSVTSIGYQAFYNCSRLASLTLHDGLQTIESGAFSSCHNLTSITIPGTVTEIKNSAFSINNLTDVTYLGTSDPASSTTIFSEQASVTIKVPADYVGDTFAGKPVERMAAYRVTFDTDGGTTIDPITAASGSTVTLPVPEKDGYVFKEWQVVSGDVTIADNKFTMPASDVQIKAVFDEAVAAVTAGETTQYYATLQEAVAAAEIFSGGAEVKLLKSVTLNTTLAVTKGNTILNLNGYTITAVAGIDYAIKISGGTHTVTVGTIQGSLDTFAESNVTLSSVSITTMNKYAVMAEGNSTLTITDSNLTSDSANGAALAAASNSTVTINSGIISGAYFGIHGSGNSTVTVNSTGSVSGGTAAVYANKNTNIAIQNGTFQSTNSVAVWTSGNTATVSVTGGTFDAETDVRNGGVTLSGGTFKDGITVTGTTLKDILADGKVYFQNDQVKEVEDSATQITGGDVTVKPVQYTVTVTNDGNGTASANPASCAANAQVTLTAVPNDGYVFDRWEVISGTVTIDENNQFTMPASDVQINAVFKLETDPISLTLDKETYGPADTSAICTLTFASIETRDKLVLYVDDAVYHTTTNFGGNFTSPWKDSINLNTLNAGNHTAYMELVPADTTKETLRSNTVSFTYSPAARYKVIVAENIEHGRVEVLPKYEAYAAGTEITLNPVPDEGYEFVSFGYTCAGTISITGHKFTMPASNVTITAVFRPKSIPVTGVTLTPDTLSLDVGDNETLTAAVTPDNATDKTLAWSSSDETVATVDADGKVTAVASGDATITARATDGSEVYAACSVHVHGYTRYTASGATITANCSGEACGQTGGTLTISASNATYNGSAHAAGLLTSDGSVFDTSSLSIRYQVKDGDALNGAPVNAGTYIASVTAGNATASVEYTISPKSLAYAEVTLSDPVIFKGQDTPTVTVKLDSVALTGGDYDTAVTSQDQREFALTVTGKGNYTGTANQTATYLLVDLPDPNTVKPNDKAAMDAYDYYAKKNEIYKDPDLAKALEALKSALTAYDITYQSAKSYVKSSNKALSFIANGHYSKFTGIEVDGKTVSTGNYEAKADASGTHITLKCAYLEALSAGKHTIKVCYTDGATDGADTFRISINNGNPITGDGTNMLYFGGIMLTSLLGMTMLLLFIPRKKGRFER